MWSLRSNSPQVSLAVEQSCDGVMTRIYKHQCSKHACLYQGNMITWNCSYNGLSLQTLSLNVNIMIIHMKLKSTEWMNSCLILFDSRYCLVILDMSQCKVLYSQTQEWRQLCVYTHHQTKPPSSLSTQTFLDWNLTCFWQSQSPNHLAFESLLLPTARLLRAAEHFISAPTTDVDFHQFQQQISLWASKHTNSVSSSLKH